MKTQEIEGQVVFENKPVDDAVVGFSPVDGNGVPAYGRSDANGIVRITSMQGGREGGGAAMGNYLVTISKVVPSREPTSEEERLSREKDIPYSIPAISVLPDKYGTKRTTPLTVAVVKGKNSFRFELEP